MSTPNRERFTDLVTRLPALRRLGRAAGGGRLPFIQQVAATDCGAACLTMVLGLFGRPVALETVRDVLRPGRDGVSAASLLKAARGFGLRARGLKIELDALAQLSRGAILHWEFSHYVVFDRVDRRGVHIMDPALGPRVVSQAQMGQSFTGVAIALEPGDDFTTGARPPNRIRAYLWKLLHEAGVWPRLLIASLLLQFVALGVPALTGAVVDRVVPREDAHLLLVLSLGFAGLVALQFVTALVRAELLLQLRTSVEVRLTVGLLEHLVDLPYGFFQSRPAGDLSMRLNSTSMIREILTAGALSGILDGGLVAVYFVVLVAASPSMALLVAALAAAQLALLLLTRRHHRELMAEGLAAQARQQTYQLELLTGMETLKMTGAEARAVARWSDLFVDSTNVALARGRLAAIIEAVTAALRVGSAVATLVFGAMQVLRGQTSLGSMLALTAIAGAVLVPIANLVATGGQLQLLGSYLERVADVLDTPREQDPERTREAPALSGSIELDRVSFQYGPATTLVVREVSVRVEPGQLVAIVGRSGSGKSTLAALLLGLHLPTSGRVLYDSIDLRELDLRSVRRQMGIVPQRPHLFGGSLRRNIALHVPDASLEMVAAAARRACIDQDIDRMPLGYDTPVVDNGAALSGGQRQRIALARALMSNPRVLLLDEATSALDATTEAAVQREIEVLECTRIVIAHRLSTVRDADVILVMDEGLLVEQGTHNELLARGGFYAQLVAAQLAPEERKDTRDAERSHAT